MPSNQKADKPAKARLSWHSLTLAPALVLWVILRACIIKCSLSEVRNRRYQHTIKPLPAINSKADLIQLTAMARELHEDTRKRREIVTGKANVLLTLSALLLPLLVAFVTKVGWLGLGIATLLLMLTCIFLLISFHGINTYERIDIRDYVAIDDAAHRKRFVQETLQITVNADCNLDFLVDVFQAARRVFLLSLIISTCLEPVLNF